MAENDEIFLLPFINRIEWEQKFRTSRMRGKMKTSYYFFSIIFFLIVTIFIITILPMWDASVAD